MSGNNQQNIKIPERSRNNYGVEARRLQSQKTIDSVSKNRESEIVVVETEDKSKASRFPNAIKSGATAGVKSVGSVLQDFKNFIDKGNVIDLAVGIVIGASFTAIVNSLVKDMITPLISLAGKANLENSFSVLKDPLGVCNDPNNRTKCSTPTIAQENNVITLNWGNFLNNIINFLLISVIVFFIVKVYSASFRRKVKPKTEACPECSEDIPITAKRCPKCTSFLEDKKTE